MEGIFYDECEVPEQKGKKRGNIEIKFGKSLTKSGVEKTFFKLVKSVIIYVLISFFTGLGVSLLIGGGLFIIFGICMTVFIVYRVLIFIRERQEESS